VVAMVWRRCNNVFVPKNVKTSPGKSAFVVQVVLTNDGLAIGEYIDDVTWVETQMSRSPMLTFVQSTPFAFTKCVLAYWPSGRRSNRT
jgi:hypothetical protein